MLPSKNNFLKIPPIFFHTVVWELKELGVEEPGEGVVVEHVAAPPIPFVVNAVPFSFIPLLLLLLLVVVVVAPLLVGRLLIAGFSFSYC